MREEKLMIYLKEVCPGRKNAKKSILIEQALHISGNDLRMLVNRLRRKGVPIASGQHGYFYAATAAEVYTTIRQLKGMVSGLDAAIRGLEDSLDAFSGESL